MTVADLIAALQRFDPATRVLTPNGDTAEFVDVDSIKAVTVQALEWDADIFEEATASAGGVNVVVIG